MRFGPADVQTHTGAATLHGATKWKLLWTHSDGRTPDGRTAPYVRTLLHTKTRQHLPRKKGQKQWMQQPHFHTFLCKLIMDLRIMLPSGIARPRNAHPSGSSAIYAQPDRRGHPWRTCSAALPAHPPSLSQGEKTPAPGHQLDVTPTHATCYKGFAQKRFPQNLNASALEKRQQVAMKAARPRTSVFRVHVKL